MKKMIFTVLSVLLVPAVTFAADTIREGLWEITTQMEMPEMPMKMPPTVMKHCYTKKDVSDQKNIISRDKNCVVSDLKTSSNKVSWKMKCTGENAATMTGETVFSNDSYSSVMKMNSHGQKMTMKVKGKRLGTCK
ncbi:MAG: DUF3617 family protein [Deltaproteobacteria bacterium]|nr:DUF3617 family protein [Deltaproteobacteria bacterium]TLN01429.1 MAG: DUF3617 family protein [bacterium]